MTVFSGAAQQETMLQGMAAFMQKDYDRAATLFSEVIRQHPGDVDAWLWRGKALFFRGDDAAALAVFREADRLRPGSGALWIARLAAREGDHDRAFKALEDHLGSSWHKPLREIMLDTLLDPLEKDPRWREIWKKEWYSRRERAAAAIRGDLALDDPAAALREADAILAHYDDDPGLLALRARASLRQGDLRAAETTLSQAMKINGSDTTVLMTAFLLARQEKDFRRMAEAGEALYRQTPAHFSLLLDVSEAWLQAGDQDKAMRYLEKYRKYFPDDIHAQLRAGELFAARGDYHSALRLLSRVVEQDPGDPYHFVTRGNVYMKVHTYRYAIYDYGMALDLDPTNGNVYYNRGEAYLKTGDIKSACFDFDRALHYGVKKAYIYLQKYCGK